MAETAKGRFLVVEHEDGRFWVNKRTSEHDARMIDQIMEMTWPDPPTLIPADTERAVEPERRASPGPPTEKPTTAAKRNPKRTADTFEWSNS